MGLQGPVLVCGQAVGGFAVLTGCAIYLPIMMHDDRMKRSQRRRLTTLLRREGIICSTRGILVSEGVAMIPTLSGRESDALIARHIGPHPAQAGLDEYWITEPGVPVWAVVGAYQVEQGNVDEVAAAYHLTREQVEAALAYYARHRALIDNRLAQNQPQRG